MRIVQENLDHVCLARIYVQGKAGLLRFRSGVYRYLLSHDKEGER